MASKGISFREQLPTVKEKKTWFVIYFGTRPAPASLVFFFSPLPACPDAGQSGIPAVG
jgi:hypothetical protein